MSSAASPSLGSLRVRWLDLLSGSAWDIVVVMVVRTAAASPRPAAVVLPRCGAGVVVRRCPRLAPGARDAPFMDNLGYV